MTTPKTEWSRVYELLETVITSSSWQFALIVIVVLFMLLFRGAIKRKLLNNKAETHISAPENGGPNKDYILPMLSLFLWASGFRRKDRD